MFSYSNPRSPPGEEVYLKVPLKCLLGCTWSRVYLIILNAFYIKGLFYEGCVSLESQFPSIPGLRFFGMFLSQLEYLL